MVFHDHHFEIEPPKASPGVPPSRLRHFMALLKRYLIKLFGKQPAAPGSGHPMRPRALPDSRTPTDAHAANDKPALDAGTQAELMYYFGVQADPSASLDKPQRSHKRWPRR